MDRNNVDSVGYSIIDLINTILNDVEKPLKKKKPDVKTALLEIDRYKERAMKLKKRLGNEDTVKKIEANEKPLMRKIYTYKCQYQCGFTTQSIREIDTHLTKEHNHPDPKRDYDHPIYNES